MQYVLDPYKIIQEFLRISLIVFQRFNPLSHQCVYKVDMKLHHTQS